MSLPARRRHFLLSGKSLFFIRGFSEHTFCSTTAPFLTALQLHSYTSELSKRQPFYTRYLYYSSWESSALLKGTLTLIAFIGHNLSFFLSSKTLSTFAQDLAHSWAELYIFAQLLTKLMNYLLPCYDVSRFIISIIGFYTQQAELQQTQGETGS